MIKSKEELNDYLMADKRAMRISLRRPRIFRDEIWKFEIYLRRLEYYTNCNKNIYNRFILLYYKFQFHRLSVKLGFYIQPNTFGKGLAIAHIGPVIVNDYAKIGSNCRIHVGVNIGGGINKPEDAPTIGENVYIGPGAKIYGRIKIGNNVAIGANAVVNKDVPDNVTVAGVPAKIVNNKGNIRNSKKE